MLKEQATGLVMGHIPYAILLVYELACLVIQSVLGCAAIQPEEVQRIGIFANRARHRPGVEETGPLDIAGLSC